MGIIWSSSPPRPPLKELQLKSSSEISTLFHCDNCPATINQVSWKQCGICKRFDLCKKCADLKDDASQKTIDQKHQKIHQGNGVNDLVNSENVTPVMVEHATEVWNTHIYDEREKKFHEIMKRGKILNDYEMAIVMDTLQANNGLLSSFLSSLPPTPEEIRLSKVNSMIVKYHTPSDENTVRVLSLDGGGVRGYMPVKVLCQLIEDNYLLGIDPNLKENQKKFIDGQSKFTKHFDYFAGTSAGGLIAFCLATNYSLLEIKNILGKPQDFFVKDWWKCKRLPDMMWNIISAKYNDQKIHAEIDRIINNIFTGRSYDGKPLTDKNATLGDLHTLLNCKDDDNLLEIAHDGSPTTDCNAFHERKSAVFLRCKKVLLITAFNTTKSSITVFNTSYPEHWGYRIADVLKATMAAPTYFRPHEMSTGKNVHGRFKKDGKDEIFIDGGVFANDPELTALWAIRMQWKKAVNYRLLSIGTGSYSPHLEAGSWGGYWSWLMKKKNTGLVVNTLMDATRSLTETVTSNLAQFNNIRRMKFNYNLLESMELDDLDFPELFNEKWDKLLENKLRDELIYQLIDQVKDKLRDKLEDELTDELINELKGEFKDKLRDKCRKESTDKSEYGLRYGPDYKALVYFYETYIKKSNKIDREETKLEE